MRRITNDVFDRVRTISIHAPQWGATERRDGVFGGGEISIHAPQWGATLTPPESRSHSAIFQSTHPSGVRRATGSAQTWTRPISIHAPQWGATWDTLASSPVVRFQSTHPSGVRRRVENRITLVITISIHAPQWGATRSRLRPTRNPAISIHAPQWGATTVKTHIIIVRDFNPRTPVGCDAGLHQ